jgi:hypothetical protein
MTKWWGNRVTLPTCRLVLRKLEEPVSVWRAVTDSSSFWSKFSGGDGASYLWFYHGEISIQLNQLFSDRVPGFWLIARFVTATFLLGSTSKQLMRYWYHPDIFHRWGMVTAMGESHVEAKESNAEGCFSQRGAGHCASEPSGWVGCWPSSISWNIGTTLGHINIHFVSFCQRTPGELLMPNLLRFQ